MNIYDIAAKSEVSIATVSRVLNNNPNVSLRTRNRVLEVMKTEGYTPNAFARGLGLGSMHMVGVLCTNIRDAFYAAAVGYVEEYLRRQGMNVVLRCTGSALEEKKSGLDYLVQKKVDAVVLIGSAFREDTDNSHIAAAARQIPVLIINGYVEQPGVYCVLCDERSAIRDLVGQLFRRQRRHILFLYDSLTYSAQQKIAGYREGCTACGAEPDPRRIVQVERDLDAVNTCVKRLLVQGVPFDAVMASEDILAIGAQKSLQRTGLSMPIIGFNNSLLSRCVTPELSTVDNAIEAQCARALEILGDLLANRDAPQKTVIPARIIERETYNNR